MPAAAEEDSFAFCVAQTLPAHHGGFEADWAVASCAGVLKARSSD